MRLIDIMSEAITTVRTVLVHGLSRREISNYQAIPVAGGDEGDAEQDGRVEKGHDPEVRLCFWIMGAGCLLTWSALMCTFPFLTSLFPSTSSMSHTLASTLSSVYCFALLIFMGLAQRSVGHGSPSAQLLWSSLIVLGCCIVFTFPLLPIVFPLLSGTSTLLLATLVAFTVLLAGATSYFQSAVLALASLWGSSEVLSVMSGQGGVAVIVSLAQLILAVIGSVNPISNTPEGDSGDVMDGTGSQSSLASVGLWVLTSLAATLAVASFRYLEKHPQYLMVLAPILERDQEDEIQKSSATGRSWRVMRKNALLYVAVASTFAITLSVFPAVTTTIVSVRESPPRLLQPDIFIPLHFLVFNIGDYVGRTYLPLLPSLLVTSHPRVLLLALLRIIFIPLFISCNLSTSPAAPLIRSDLLYFAICLLCGLSNGYIGSLCMIVASTPGLNPRITEEEKDYAGTLGAFFLVGGLSLGSMASFGVARLAGVPVN